MNADLTGVGGMYISGSPSLLSIIQLCQLFAFSFGNGVLISSYFIVTLPIESKLINMDKRALVLGGFIAVAGVTQLICPIVGLYSDRCTHRWGKRRPFIFYGGLVGSLGLILQLIARSNQIWWIYIIAFTISMLSLNVIFSSMNGLIADFVPEKQVGTANGIIAGLSVFGAVTSFAVFQILTNHMDAFYVFYVFVIAITCMITFFAADGNTTTTETVATGYDYPETGHDYLDDNTNYNPITFQDIRAAFYISPVEHRDFFYIFISRTLFYMGVSSQTFLMYYLRDTLSMSEQDAESYTAVLAVTGQFCGIMTAFPAGYLSDRFGKGRKNFIFGACFVLAACNMALIFAESKTAVFWIACTLGMGNGVYLTSDASLAIDALPNREEAARFMGIWGVGAFLGTAFGPFISGPFLVLNSEKKIIGESSYSEYSRFGYAALLSASALYFFGSAYVLKWVRTK